MRGPSKSKESVFDSVPEIYNSVRPSYPDALIDDLIKTAKLSSESKILEIGTGTGKLTKALARKGLLIHGLELGENLAGIARKNLSDFQGTKISVGDFDTWDFENEEYNLVVSATAFHWLDKDTRVRRIADALRQNGMVAIIDTVHVDGHTDGFPMASQACYRKWSDNSTGDYLHPTLQAAMAEGFRRKGEFRSLFSTVIDKPYAENIKYDSETYLKLLQTYSDVISMREPNRRGFLSCIGDMIEKEFHGSIDKSYVWQLFMAAKK